LSIIFGAFFEVRWWFISGKVREKYLSYAR